MCRENKLIIQLTHPNLDNNLIEEIEESFNSNLDWSKLIGLIHYHRIPGPIWINIKKHNIKCGYPHFLYMLSLIHKAQIMRSKEQIDQLKVICNILEENNIPYNLLKGVALSKFLYHDIGSRFSSDIDILISPLLIDKTVSLLKQQGFIQGIYSFKLDEVVPASRREILLSSMTSHEIFPMVKRVTGQFINYIQLDIHFSLDILTNNRTDALVNTFLEDSLREDSGFRIPLWEHHLLFLCNHFYKEGLQDFKQQIKKGILLYKLLDIHYILTTKKLNTEIINTLIHENSFKKSIYLTLKYLETLYPFANYPIHSDDYRTDIILPIQISTLEEKEIINSLFSIC